jgi:hypothetical protein
MRDPALSPATSSRAGRILDAVLIGLPDAVTGSWCLWVWIHPLALGADTVKAVVLMMLMEFILLNATGFFTAIPFMIGLARSARIAMLLGLCAIYVLLIFAFALPFHAVWPFFAFGWLALGKLAWVMRNRRVSGDEQLWLIGAWAFSVVAYLGAVGAGVLLDLPRLGITADIVPSLHLPGGGEWVETPHKAVATAVLYFAASAVFKWMCAALRKFHPDRRRAADLAGGALENVRPFE